MTKDEILAMAREAFGSLVFVPDSTGLLRFAALVDEASKARRIELQKQIEALQEQIKRADMEKALAVAQERERCAKVCEQKISFYCCDDDALAAAEYAAAAIREKK